MNELVSIIITTYNGKESVVRAVESCLGQTYEPKEVIVVDDSGEGTEAQRRTEKYLYPYIQNNQIKYIAHKKNMNASVARNTGFKNSKGKYIALLDDDDVFMEKKIEEQVKALKEHDSSYGVAYCAFLDIIEDGQVLKHLAEGDGDVLYEFLMMKISACTSSILIRRELYQKLGGFDESFQRHQDWEFLARAASVSKFIGVPYIGMKKYTRNIVKRFSADKAEKYRLYFIEKIAPCIAQLPRKQSDKVYEMTYTEIAKLFFREKNFSKTVYYIKKSGNMFPFLYALLKKPFEVIKDRNRKTEKVYIG